MISYRQLCFWIALATATTVAAQQPTDQYVKEPSAASQPEPATSQKVSEKKAAAGTGASDVEPQTEAAESAEAPDVKPPRVRAGSLPKATFPGTRAAAAPRVIIIESDPKASRSEVIRQVFEALEKDGTARRSRNSEAVAGGGVDITVEVQAQADTATNDVLDLIQSLQVLGVHRLRLSIPTEKRNVAIVFAPADVPWRTIEGLKEAITKQNKFAVEIRVAEKDNLSIARISSGSNPYYGFTTGTPAENVIGRSDPPVSQSEPSVADIEKALQRSTRIGVMMGRHNLLLPVLEKVNTGKLAEAIVSAIGGRKDMEMWVDGQHLQIQTSQQNLSKSDLADGDRIEQEIARAVTLRNEETVGATAQAGTPRPNPLDKQKERPLPFTQMFRLQTADATLVAKVLGQLFREEIGIAPDARTNALIVRGKKQQLQELEALVKMLDGVPSKQDAASTPPGAAPMTIDVAVGGEMQTQSFFVSVPATSVPGTRTQIQEFDRRIRETVASLRSMKPTSNGEAEAKLKHQLRELVAQAFLARRALQQAELSEFSARLERIRQSIAVRNRIAAQIIDRRVEELLDPNLKWEMGKGTPPPQRDARAQSAAKQSSLEQEPASGRSRITTEVHTTNGAMILKTADEFRKVLRGHVKRVADVKKDIAAWETTLKEAEEGSDTAQAQEQIRMLAAHLVRYEADQKFALKEYAAQMKLLELEVESSHVAVKEADKALQRLRALHERKVVTDLELDEFKNSASELNYRHVRSRTLLELYRDAGGGN